MKIIIAGAGAMGSRFGLMLHQAEMMLFLSMVGQNILKQ